jgi:Co/Zn/Cd efflux system component
MYSDPIVFLIVFLSTFLSLLGLAHPSLSFFTRFLVYFSYTDLNFSIIHSGKRRYFVGCVVPLIVLLERLSLTALLCVAGIGFVSLFVSISFPAAMFRHQRCLRVELNTLVLALFLQFLLVNRIPRWLLVISLALACPDRLCKLPELKFTRAMTGFAIVTFALTFCEFWISLRQGSAALFALSLHTLNAGVYSLSTRVLTNQVATSRFPFGFVRLRKVAALGVVVFTMFCSFCLVADSADRLLHPFIVGEPGLFVASLFFVAVDLFQLLQLTIFGGLGCSAWSSLIGSLTVVASSVLIDAFGWYALDAICEFVVAATLVHFGAPILRHLVGELTMSSGRSDTRAIGRLLKAKGKVNDFHVWDMKEDFAVATFRLSFKDQVGGMSSRDIIEDLQKMNVRNVTMEIV